MIKEGDFLIYQGGNGFIDLPIKLFTLSIYSHVAIARKYGFMTEALPGGVVRSKIRTKDLTIVRNTTGTKAGLKKALIWLNEQEGKEYDYVALAGVVLNKFGIKKAHLLDSLNRWFCSELGMGFAKIAGMKSEYNDKYNDKYITPADMYRDKYNREV